jgi:ABC-type phosphate/phosphonate transport system permease subunit
MRASPDRRWGTRVSTVLLLLLVALVLALLFAPDVSAREAGARASQRLMQAGRAVQEPASGAVRPGPGGVG